MTDLTGFVSVLADQVAQLQIALSEMTDRHTKEKKRRQELHNVLMVLFSNCFWTDTQLWVLLACPIQSTEPQLISNSVAGEHKQMLL